MGWQYQHEAYRSRLEEAGIVQSMFGHIKDEFSRNRTWPDFESFKADLEAYIIHWNTVRRQAKLKGLTPEEFRNQSQRAA